MRNRIIYIATVYRSPNALKFSIVSGMAILVLLSGCANQSVLDGAAFSDTLAIQCPSGSVRQCEVWGGNKFKKRYHRCGCAAYR